MMFWWNLDLAILSVIFLVCTALIFSCSPGVQVMFGRDLDLVILAVMLIVILVLTISYLWV
jgi:hypothetical protein